MSPVELANARISTNSALTSPRSLGVTNSIRSFSILIVNRHTCIVVTNTKGRFTWGPGSQVSSRLRLIHATSTVESLEVGGPHHFKWGLKS
jgi:hypothetical protein